ncbi:helix-turn-helix domain-containing protein [Cohnella xylanilytica]|uniref:Helix-turn-helix domain-containing protein n=1 Tax=Cohnella xylanilytica TaxID=557555 RepID=A0A841U2J9_9BACL|nr:helix-turn-helix domain-containing protein [Cohnella xylanilytica]MBB6692320.1 helix-turn-helix domain-containing protein [Cohnella xylanilytica]
MRISDLPEILTVKQIAEHIGWHPNTVYLRCKSGELRSFKSGNSRRIRKSAYIEWMAKLERQERV